MKTTGLAALAPLGAFAVLALAGCGAEFGAVGGPYGSPTRIAEGTGLRGTLIETVEIEGADGAPFMRSLPAAPFTATVRGGVAEIDAAGAVIAHTRRAAYGGRALAFSDAEGGRHELVLVESPQQGPPAEVRYFKNGELLIEGAYTWDRRDGGWLLRDRTIAVYRGGQPILRHLRTVEATEVARGTRATAELARMAATGLAHLAPRPLEAQNLGSCLSEWVEYAAAAGALTVATAGVLGNPFNPAAWSALATAISVWERALTQVLDCEVINAEP